MTTLSDAAPGMGAGDGGAPAPARATRKEWIGLAVLALPCMLYSMDLTVLNLAIPSLAADLRPTAGELLWIIDIYGFMVAGFLMAMGSIGDRIGRRRLLLIGAAAFGAASVLAAFSATATQLIVARALLGVAGATLAPSTLSLISSMFRDERERTFAISMWIMSYSVGAIIGPVVGGMLIAAFWWGAVFLAGVPVMLLLLVLGPILLPEFRDGQARRIDIVSTLLSLAAVLSLIYGVKHWAEFGAGAEAGAALAVGAVLAFAFFRRQRRVADPMVDLGLFARRTFSISLSINALGLFFMFGSFVFTAQYLQLVAGLTPLAAGLWSLPFAIAFAAMSPFTAALATRFTPVRVMSYGLAISAGGFALLALAESLVGVTAANVAIAVGITPVAALTTGFIVGAAPVEKAGVAAAISETGAEFGGALGIALLGSLLTAIYGAAMSGIELPALTPDLDAAARATLAGALEATVGLGAEDADRLLAPARAAFLNAFSWVAILGAVALGGLAVVTRRALAPAVR